MPLDASNPECLFFPLFTVIGEYGNNFLSTLLQLITLTHKELVYDGNNRSPEGHRVGKEGVSGLFFFFSLEKNQAKACLPLSYSLLIPMVVALFVYLCNYTFA